MRFRFLHVADGLPRRDAVTYYVPRVSHCYLGTFYRIRIVSECYGDFLHMLFFDCIWEFFPSFLKMGFYLVQVVANETLHFLRGFFFNLLHDFRDFNAKILFFRHDIAVSSERVLQVKITLHTFLSFHAPHTYHYKLSETKYLRYM